MDVDELKQRAVDEALTHVRSGMTVGLGHGSTARLAIARLGGILRDGRLSDVVGVPCSDLVEAEAREAGIPLSTLESRPVVDLTIDGADEVDPRLNLIKGAGGALLREKMVAQASRREIIVVDESKLSPALGTRCAVPVEVVRYAWRLQKEYLERLGARVSVRGRQDAPYVTDNGNLILDCFFGPVQDPAQLADRIRARVGVVEHGLFLGLATDVVVAAEDGVRYLRAEADRTGNELPGSG